MIETALFYFQYSKSFCSASNFSRNIPNTSIRFFLKNSDNIPYAIQSSIASDRACLTSPPLFMYSLEVCTNSLYSFKIRQFSINSRLWQKESYAL